MAPRYILVVIKIIVKVIIVWLSEVEVVLAQHKGGKFIAVRGGNVKMKVVAGHELGLDLLARWAVNVREVWLFFEGLIDYDVGGLLNRVFDNHWQCLRFLLLLIFL